LSFEQWPWLVVYVRPVKSFDSAEAMKIGSTQCIVGFAGKAVMSLMLRDHTVVHKK
jgi:predicted CDP-diglyceride synthetase/phosphatidate cytidylyltransferase